MKRIFLLAIAGSLTGCATPSPEEAAFKTAQRDAYCKQYAQPGSPAFKGCHQTIEKQERQQKAAKVAAVLDDIAAQQAANRPVNTTCNRFGSSINCTSY